MISNITFVNLDLENVRYIYRRFLFYYTNVYQQSKISVQTTGIECNDVTQ